MLARLLISLLAASALAPALWRNIPITAGVFLAVVLVLASLRAFGRGLEVDWSSPSGAPYLFGSPVVARWIGFELLLFALAFLEIRQPYYFSQDDNFAQFLPVMIQGSKSFFAGVFPSWNPYNLLGQPTTCTGVYSLTYPITHFSYLISNLIRGNGYLLMELFCAFHLLAGYWVMLRYLEEYWKASAEFAAAASLGFVLSGFFLVAGRSWYYMVPLALWVPLSFLFFERFIATPTVRTSVLWGLVLGLQFHAGNTQMWLYTAILSALCVVLSSLGRDKLSRTHIWGLGLALLVCVVSVAPLGIPQYLFVRDISRGAWGNGIAGGLHSLLLPYPLSVAKHPNGWGNVHPEDMADLFYCGLVFGLAVLWVCADFLSRSFRWKARRIRTWVVSPTHRAALLLLLVLSLALGGDSYTWPLQAKLPIFSKFSNPLKFLCFIAFFFACIGSEACTRIVALLLSRSSKGTARVFAGGALALTLGMLVLHLAHSRTAFYSYGDLPYPELPWQMRERLSDKRISSNAPWRFDKPGYVKTLHHNFPAVYEILSAEGYDPLVEGKPESRTGISPANLGEFGVSESLAFNSGSVAPVILTPVKDAKPLVFSDQPGHDPSLLRLSGNGLSFQINPAPVRRAFTLCFTWRKGMVAELGGKPTKIAPDDLRRIRFSVEPGEAGELRLTYQPLWRWGYGLVLLNFLGLIWVLASVRQPRPKPGVTA